MKQPSSFAFDIDRETGVATITLDRPDRMNV